MEFYPTDLAKLTQCALIVCAARTTRVLDAGCGEGVLVEEFKSRLAIAGVDPNYSSELVAKGSLAALPYPDGSFDRALCLDVLEHLTFPAGAGYRGVVRVVRRGELLISVPNLAICSHVCTFCCAGV